MSSHRTCEICGLQERHYSGKLFFARFPTDELRCKEWVKVIGKEDLVYLPIKKLHSLRFVCANHFEKRDFTKTKTRLKKRAVPKLGLQMPPVPDDLLREFALSIPTNINGKDSPVQADGGPNQGDGSPDQGDGSPKQGDGSPDLGDGSPNQCDGGPSQAPEAAMECDYMPVDDDEFATDDEQADETVVIPHDPSEDDNELLRGDGASAGLIEDDAEDLALHDGFRCNECGDDIRGFRYSCVQCADYDLCGACERDKRHSRHYVLRIPRPKSYAEVQAVFKSIRRKLRLLLETKRADRDTDDDDDIVSVKSEVKEESPDPLLFVNAEEPTDTSENIQMEQYEESDSQYQSNLQAEGNVSQEHSYSKKELQNVRQVGSNIIRTQGPHYVIPNTNRAQQTNKDKKLLLVITPPKQDGSLDLQNSTLTPTTERLISPIESVGLRPTIPISTQTTKPSIEGQSIANISNNQLQEPTLTPKNVNVTRSPKNVNKKSTGNVTFTIATRHGSKSTITLKNSNVGGESNLVQKLINRHRIASPFTVTKSKMLTPVALKDLKTLRVVSKTEVPGQESLKKPIAGITNSTEVKTYQRHRNVVKKADGEAIMTNMGTEV